MNGHLKDYNCTIEILRPDVLRLPVIRDVNFNSDWSCYLAVSVSLSVLKVVLLVGGLTTVVKSLLLVLVAVS